MKRINQSNYSKLSRDCYLYISKSLCLWLFYIEPLTRMDVVPDKDLYDFIDSIDDGGTVKEEASDMNNNNNNNPPPSSSSDASDDEEDDDIWEGIASALDNWTRRILDAEARHSKSVNFYQRIEESLARQQQDGFLADSELAELRYIAGLWQHLLDATACYTVGCDFLKRDIIGLLLDLHSVRQISSSVFIDTCLKL